jgi:hypothetical protein
VGGIAPAEGDVSYDAANSRLWFNDNQIILRLTPPVSGGKARF